uniref:Uncharacterized protein n=1 Tax=Florenciella parvula TaxID=236787 RepID=A0A7S2CLB2_9STRA|mmetsp:Transcript_30613/g.62498  ORF Transcript_30613/g.62498 Transcript_30613/m.62498 type:complete len:386 (+) Transcript_30613:140-1297(+)
MDVESKQDGEAGAGRVKGSRPPRNVLCECVGAAIFKIPICGGFCAPNNSPVDSCLRHFSNEETVPQPCLRRRTCRTFFEHNSFVRNFGRIGFVWADRHRSKIMLSAFAVSFVAWLMTISAAFANSSNAAVVQNTYWAQGEVDGGSLTYKLGLNVIVVEKDGGTSTIEWADHACDPITFNSDEHGEVSVERPFCSACSAAANKCIKLVITAMITQVFQITTDLQRTTSYGDLNCQKLFGFSTSVYGMYSTWDSLVSFRYDCGMKSSLPPWRRDGTVDVTNSTGGIMGDVPVEHTAGPGYVLLLLAGFLKVYDVICHIIVPTPERNHKPAKMDLELDAYMLESVEDGSESLTKEGGLSEAGAQQIGGPAPKTEEPGRAHSGSSDEGL